MKSWSYGINTHFKTASVFLREGPWWAFFLDWFADHSCGLIPEWHLPVIKNRRLVVNGEETTFGEYYGTLHDLYHMFVCQKLMFFADSKVTTKALQVEWDKCRELFYERDKAYWDAELQDEEVPEYAPQSGQ